MALSMQTNPDQMAEMVRRGIEEQVYQLLYQKVSEVVIFEMKNLCRDAARNIVLNITEIRNMHKDQIELHVTFKENANANRSYP